jgi:hypothetical protein
MELNDHLDKIERLGFDIEILWNKNIRITYSYGDYYSNYRLLNSTILSFLYDKNLKYEFEDLIVNTCDEFYTWYNKNLKLINDFESNSCDKTYDILVNSYLGDITKRVYRNFNIDELLD